MNYSILTLPDFDKEIKRLSKKYPSLKQDFANFLKELRSNPHAGIELAPGLRKVRMAIKSKGKGKSHGARIITFEMIINDNDGVLYLIYIYDKKEISSVKKEVLIQMLTDYGIIM